MAKPVMKMVVDKPVEPEYVQVEFVKEYGGTHTLYLNGLSISIVNSKAKVTQGTKKLLMDNKYIK